MKRPLVSLLILLACALHLVLTAHISEHQDNETDRDYWLRRKEWFYKRTEFDLTDDNLKLLGPKRLMFENKSAQPQGHLPFWFDYKLFKKVFNKRSADNEEEERARHNQYINSCIRTLKARVLFRMLAGTSDTFITSDADKVSKSGAQLVARHVVVICTTRFSN
jgi:hypothetical protein